MIRVFNGCELLFYTLANTLDDTLADFSDHCLDDSLSDELFEHYSLEDCIDG